jgi:alanyl-tRNA synthetase
MVTRRNIPARSLGFLSPMAVAASSKLTVTGRFSAALDDTPALVDRQRIDLRDAHATRDSLLHELATYQARDRLAVTAPNGSGRRVVTELISAGPLDALRPFALAVASVEGAIFIGALDDPASIMLATSPSSGIDAGAVLKELLAASGGRGGGSARVAQGSLPSKDALMHLIAALGTIFS